MISSMLLKAMLELSVFGGYIYWYTIIQNKPRGHYEGVLDCSRGCHRPRSIQPIHPARPSGVCFIWRADAGPGRAQRSDGRSADTATQRGRRVRFLRAGAGLLSQRAISGGETAPRVRGPG